MKIRNIEFIQQCIHEWSTSTDVTTILSSLKNMCGWEELTRTTRDGGCGSQPRNRSHTTQAFGLIVSLITLITRTVSVYIDLLDYIGVIVPVGNQVSTFAKESCLTDWLNLVELVQILMTYL